MIVSSPASSANLGSGFDCLALALDLPFELSDDPARRRGLAGGRGDPPGSGRVPRRGRRRPTDAVVAQPHPAGSRVWASPALRGSPVPILAGLARRARASVDARDGSFRVATRLEGTPTTPARLRTGGFVGDHAGARGPAATCPPGCEPLVWSPSSVDLDRCLPSGAARVGADWPTPRISIAGPRCGSRRLGVRRPVAAADGRARTGCTNRVGSAPVPSRRGARGLLGDERRAGRLAVGIGADDRCAAGRRWPTAQRCATAARAGRSGAACSTSPMPGSGQNPDLVGRD